MNRARLADNPKFWIALLGLLILTGLELMHRSAKLSESHVRLLASCLFGPKQDQMQGLYGDRDTLRSGQVNLASAAIDENDTVYALGRGSPQEIILFRFSRSGARLAPICLAAPPGLALFPGGFLLAVGGVRPYIWVQAYSSSARTLVCYDSSGRILARIGLDKLLIPARPWLLPEMRVGVQGGDRPRSLVIAQAIATDRNGDLFITNQPAIAVVSRQGKLLYCDRFNGPNFVTENGSMISLIPDERGNNLSVLRWTRLDGTTMKSVHVTLPISTSYAHAIVGQDRFGNTYIQEWGGYIPGTINGNPRVRNLLYRVSPAGMAIGTWNIATDPGLRKFRYAGSGIPEVESDDLPAIPLLGRIIGIDALGNAFIEAATHDRYEIYKMTW